jgi:hypothetical protein
MPSVFLAHRMSKLALATSWAAWLRLKPLAGLSEVQRYERLARLADQVADARPCTVVVSTIGLWRPDRAYRQAPR